VRVTKPLIRFRSFLLKPPIASKHSWVMRRGQENFPALPRRGRRKCYSLVSVRLKSPASKGQTAPPPGRAGGCGKLGPEN
jgi:hypothetical protein